MSEQKTGSCNNVGPTGARCTERPGHTSIHYDGADDPSWDDNWREGRAA